MSSASETTPIFELPAALPRGPHRLSREEVADSQRTRLMAAFTSLMAEGGYAAVRIGDLAARAGVSRGAFYEHFADKQACLFAAYDRFAATLMEAIAASIDDRAHWSAFVDTALRGYIGVLQRDPVAARAFIVEMDAAGVAARRRRREAMHTFAALLEQRHEQIRARDRSLGELPRAAYLGLVFGVRDLVEDALVEGGDLDEVAEAVVVLATAMVRGAAAAGGSA